MTEPTRYELAILWALNQKPHMFQGIDNPTEHRARRKARNKAARAARRITRRRT